MRPTFAEINLKHLLYNYRGIKRKVGNAKVMAVVKADAYGHGMIECVKALETLGERRPAYYAVALLEEAIELKKAHITKQPVICFAPLAKDELDEYVKYKIIPTITDIKQYEVIKKFKLPKSFPVHVNIDTGMGRVGIKYTQAVDFIKRLSGIKNIVIDGVYTHFATSDEKDKTFSKLQLNRFSDILKKLKELNINYGLAHAANSGAILDIPESYFDMVRAGISLYGYYPSMETSESIKLKPVMSIVSKISSVNIIGKGDSVSYGRRFVAREKTKIVSVPIGYADGIRRGLTNWMKGIIKNKFYHQVGTITMDRIMFDVNDDNIKIGDRIILIGKSKNLEITAVDWCKILDTIPYEITCGIGKRVPRIYRN